MPLPDVEVAQVETRDVPIVKEWVGSLDGRVNAEIRGQVTGYLLRQDYREGAFVRKGDLLFEIDPRPFEAALNQAKANLAQAHGSLLEARGTLAQSEARLGKADLDVKRYTPLVKTRAISQEDMDNATQSQLEAKAAVETAKAAIEAANAAIEAAKAAVDDAELRLGFTRITSPVDGISGLATVQIGNLVSPTSGVLTMVSTVDPIKAYFTVSEQEYLSAHRPAAAGSAGMWSKGLELVLADGTIYPRKGTIFMEDRQVDVGTGTLRMAALFPNPGNILRPGQYCRVRAVTGTNANAVVVPERAVGELQGGWQVAVVGEGNKVTMRNVHMGAHLGDLWVVEDGVKPGERVIVEGLLKVRSGVVVNPKAAVRPASAD
jgi:membrane fusion protein (multidrug efflux system)